MSKKYFLVPDEDAIYAIPVDECKKFALDGDMLKAAKQALEELEPDVEGQMELYNSNSGKYANKSSTWTVDVGLNDVSVKWTLSFR